MIRHRSVRKKGYIALISVLIVTAIGIAVTTELLLLGVSSAKTTIDLELSKVAHGMADACSEDALELVRDNNSYTGTNTVTIGSNTCSYTVTNGGGSVRIITTASTVNNVVRKTQIVTSQLTPKITLSSWQEVQ